MILGADILPDTSGRSLGAQDARWDAQLRNINVSGTISGNFIGLAIFKLNPNIVPYSATPVLNGANGTGMRITLLGNAVPAIINVQAGSLVSFVIIQDNTGGRTWAWPGNFRGGMGIGMGIGEASGQLFWFDGATYWALTPGVIS